MKVALYDTVKPSDGSETLPRGTYEISEVRWISYRDLGGHHRGVATFVVTEGEHASSRRRIGCVTDEPGELRRTDKS